MHSCHQLHHFDSFCNERTIEIMYLITRMHPLFLLALKLNELTSKIVIRNYIKICDVIFEKKIKEPMKK